MVAIARTLSTLAIAFGAVHSAQAAPAEPAAAAPSLSITSIGVNGSGCPPGTAQYVIDPSRSTLNIFFQKFFAHAGPNVEISENRKNCQITLGVNIPAGRRFSIASVDSFGFFKLDSSVTAVSTFLSYFQGQLEENKATSPAKTGPSEGVYNFENDIIISSPVKSQCGGSTILNINTDVRVSNSNNKSGSGWIGQVTQEVSTRNFGQAFNIEWETC